jgi:transaldolase
MKATGRLHDAGQSLWLDNITRALLNGRGLARCVRELSVTGLTSNPVQVDLLACVAEKGDRLQKAG